MSTASMIREYVDQLEELVPNVEFYDSGDDDCICCQYNRLLDDLRALADELAVHELEETE